jgi:hypothetical protein
MHSAKDRRVGNYGSPDGKTERTYKQNTTTAFQAYAQDATERTAIMPENEFKVSDS